MEQAEVIESIREAIWLTIQISTPIMLIGLFVGVLIALLQALTQIQEITLVFVPKIIAIFMAIFFLLPSYSLIMIAYMERIADRIIGGG